MTISKFRHAHSVLGVNGVSEVTHHRTANLTEASNVELNLSYNARLFPTGKNWESIKKERKFLKLKSLVDGGVLCRMDSLNQVELSRPNT